MKINNEFMDYIIEDIKTLIENEMEEHPNKFPYTLAFNKIFNETKIKFSKDLLSENLLSIIVEEILMNMHKSERSE